MTLDDVRSRGAGLVGEIDQVPPMVSAVKVGGRRLHELARQGIEVERQARRVHVDRFDVDATPDPRVYRIVVECSSGTYVRVLAADLGRALGGGAHLRRLRRTAIGSFGARPAPGRSTRSVPTSVLAPAAVVAPPRAVRRSTPSWRRSVAHGRVLALDVLRADRRRARGPCSTRDGALLAVYERRPTSQRGPSRASSSAGGPVASLADGGDHRPARVPGRRPRHGGHHRLLRRRAPRSPGAHRPGARAGRRTRAAPPRSSRSTVIRPWSCGPSSAPRLLTDLDQRLELLAAIGVDYCVVIHFDEERAAEPAEDFVIEVLVDCLSARAVAVGEDFHFGRGRGGNVALLERLGPSTGSTSCPSAWSRWPGSTSRCRRPRSAGC